jgi:hypothetical protein
MTKRDNQSDSAPLPNEDEVLRRLLAMPPDPRRTKPPKRAAKKPAK